MKQFFSLTLSAVFIAALLIGRDAGTSLTDKEGASSSFVVEINKTANSSSLEKNDQFGSFSQVGFDVCGELADFEGYFHPVFNVVPDGAGGFHVKAHFNAKGTGVGQTSGATYQWNDSINISTNAKTAVPALGLLYSYMASHWTRSCA